MSETAMDPTSIKAAVSDGKKLDKLASSIDRLMAEVRPAVPALNCLSRSFGRLGEAITALNRFSADAVFQQPKQQSEGNQPLFNSLAELKQWVPLIGKVESKLKGVLEIMKFIGASVGEMNEYVGTTRRFGAAMGGLAQEGSAFAKSLESGLGLDYGEVLQNVDSFQQLASSCGIASRQSYVLSENMTQLGYDLSSYFQISPEEAFKELQAAITGTGNVFGRVDTSPARMQQELYALGIDQSVNSLSQADGALLRYIAILKQASFAQGDMAQSLTDPANAVAVLQSQIVMAARWIGAIFIPAIARVSVWIIAFIRAVSQIARAVAEAFHLELPEMKPVEAALGGTVGGLDAVGGSAEAAKKKMDYLIGGFDELNILSKDDAVKAPSAEGMQPGNILGEVGLPSYDGLQGAVSDDIKQKTEALIGPLQEALKLAAAVGAAFLTWKVAAALAAGIDGAVKGLTNLKAAMAGISFANMSSAMNGILKMLWTSASGFSGAIATAGPTVAAIAAVVGIMVWRFMDLYQNSESFRTGLSRAWELICLVRDSIMDLLAYFGELAVEAGKWVLSFLPDDVRETILATLDKIKTFFREMDLGVADFGITAIGFGLLFTPAAPFGIALLAFEALTAIIRAIGSVGEESWAKFKTAVSDGLNGVVETITTMFSKENLEALFMNFGGTILGILAMPFTGGMSIFYGLGFDLINGLFMGLTEAIFGRKISIAEVFGNIINWFKGLFGINSPSTVFAGFGQNIIDGLLGGLAEKWAGIVSWWSIAINSWWDNGVKGCLSVEKWKQLGKDAIDGLFNGLGGILEKVQSWGTNLIDAIKERLGIHSPSTVMRDEVGLNLASGIALGLTAGLNGIVGAAGAIVEAVQGVFNGVTYNLDTDYTALRNEALAAGDTEAALDFESQRRAKIQGEGLSYALDDDKSLLLQQMGVKADLTNENLTALNDLNTVSNEMDTSHFELSQEARAEDTKLYAGLLQSIIDQSKLFETNLKLSLDMICRELNGAADRIVASTDQIRVNIYNTYVSRSGGDAFASGGFPQRGEMFIAREAGPELVGQIGGRAAVANNDQIVEAVAAGVASAVASVVSRIADSGTTVIELDGEVIYSNQKKVGSRRGYDFGMGAFAR